MVVKILNTQTYVTTCYTCKSKLEYEYNDVTKEKVSDYSGSSDTYNKIVCPVCKNKTTVSFQN